MNDYSEETEKSWILRMDGTEVEACVSANNYLIYLDPIL